MHLTLQSLPPTPGPDPLTLLHHLASTTPRDLTLLHDATHATPSVLAFDPLLTLEVDSTGTPPLQSHLDDPTANRKSKIENRKFPNPLAALEQFINAISFPAPHPLIGFLGFLSYDLARTLDPPPSPPLIPTLAPPPPDQLHWPLLRFTLFRHYLLHDPAQNLWTPISLESNPTESRDILLDATNLHSSIRQLVNSSIPPSPARILNEIPPAAFQEKIQRAKEYIAAGDIYQANLAQHWQIQTPNAPHEIYARLCAASPAPYSAYLRFTSPNQPPRHVLSASPELFLNLNQNQLLTRPIKGTRPRDLANPAHDQALRNELLASPKDQAELAMIVDLLRNDLGRISQFGSVQVNQPRTLEPHPTVWHTVATISSQLRPNTGLAEILTALCPGGSITGAPKIRAMQIIEELEKSRRALYCGNIGVIAPQAHSLTLNIAIRTILMQNQIATLHAGAGIVADSNPQLEYEETLHKAAALFRALGMEPPHKKHE